MRRTAALGSALLDALERDEGEGEEKGERAVRDKNGRIHGGQGSPARDAWRSATQRTGADPSDR